MKRKGLIIEDDRELAELVVLELGDIGFQVEMAHDGALGLEMALQNDYAFVVLDIMLPGLDGVEVCKAIREKNKSLPIVMLTAKTDDLSKILLLELGADDYMTKPFNPLELKARLKAVLRRAGNTESADNSETLSFKGLEINFLKRRVMLNGQVLEFTPREYDLLFLLASEPGRPFSRAELNERVYGMQVSGYEKSVTSHINRIRQKIEPNIEQPTFIRTVRGIGYCFVDPDLNEE